MRDANTARIAGTHGASKVRTLISNKLVRGELCFGLSLPGIVSLALWIIYILVAMFLNPRKAWPLALLTTICLVSFVLVQTGYMTKIRRRMPIIPVTAHITILAVLGCCALAIIGYQIFTATYQRSYRLQALLGTTTFIALSTVLSWNRSDIPWPQVVSAALTQFFLGVFVLSTSVGMQFFESAGNSVSSFLQVAEVGAAMVFGPDPLETHFFAFKVLPVTIYFSAFISVMYYLGVMQIVVRVIAIALKKLIGTSLVQSVNAAGNLFLGQTEAPLLVKPFLDQASPCDLHCVMVGGFASVAGGVLAAYIGMGVNASQLIGASVMSVPGTLLVSNIVCPPGSLREEEVGRKAEEPRKDDSDADSGDAADDDHFDFPAITENNVIEAAGNGTHTAIDLVLNIGAMLIAFIALLKAVDMGLGHLGTLVNIPDLCFEMICGYVFWPIAWLIGTPFDDCTTVAKLIGTKVFLNEFVAYDKLSKMVAMDGVPLDEEYREISHYGQLVATYALCGFSNIGSVGIQLGCLSSLSPSRSKAFAKLVTSAMITGNVVCFLTATFAALLADSD